VCPTRLRARRSHADSNTTVYTFPSAKDSDPWFWTKDHQATVASACIGLLICGVLVGVLARWRAQNRAAAARAARRDVLTERDPEKGSVEGASDGAKLGALPVYLSEGENVVPAVPTEEEGGAARTVEVTTPNGKRILSWGTQQPLSLPTDMNISSVPTNPISPGCDGQAPTLLSPPNGSASGAHTEPQAELTPENMASTSSASAGVSQPPDSSKQPVEELLSKVLAWDGQLPSAERRASKSDLSSGLSDLYPKDKNAAPGKSTYLTGLDSSP
jgi:hypothetical protein